MQDLIGVLVQSQKTKSIEVARNLKLISVSDKISKNNGPKLQTLCLSFNQDLKYEGIITIINHLPKTTSATAFVECRMTDKLGRQLLITHQELLILMGYILRATNFQKIWKTSLKNLG